MVPSIFWIPEKLTKYEEKGTYKASGTMAAIMQFGSFEPYTPYGAPNYELDTGKYVMCTPDDIQDKYAIDVNAMISDMGELGNSDKIGILHDRRNNIMVLACDAGMDIPIMGARYMDLDNTSRHIMLKSNRGVVVLAPWFRTKFSEYEREVKGTKDYLPKDKKAKIVNDFVFSTGGYFVSSYETLKVWYDDIKTYHSGYSCYDICLQHTFRSWSGQNVQKTIRIVRSPNMELHKVDAQTSEKYYLYTGIKA